MAAGVEEGRPWRVRLGEREELRSQREEQLANAAANNSPLVQGDPPMILEEHVRLRRLAPPEVVVAFVQKDREDGLTVKVEGSLDLALTAGRRDVFFAQDDEHPA